MQKSRTQRPEHASQACFGKSVLLVDTDEINHQLHRIYLKKYKIKLICTKSLRHAFWLVQEHPPDIILTEIYFNGYLNYEHLFLLRKEKLMPVIVQSSQPPQLHAENCKIRGAEAYFTKPLNWQEYLKCIEGCLVNTPGP